jgi:hypothetical protein
MVELAMGLRRLARPRPAENESLLVLAREIRPVWIDPRGVTGAYSEQQYAPNNNSRKGEEQILKG